MSIWCFIIILQLKALQQDRTHLSSSSSSSSSFSILFFTVFAPAAHFGLSSLGLVVKVITARTTAGRAIRSCRRRGRRRRRPRRLRHHNQSIIFSSFPLRSTSMFAEQPAADKHNTTNVDRFTVRPEPVLSDNNQNIQGRWSSLLLWTWRRAGRCSLSSSEFNPFCGVRLF